MTGAPAMILTAVPSSKTMVQPRSSGRETPLFQVFGFRRVLPVRQHHRTFALSSGFSTGILWDAIVDDAAGVQFLPAVGIKGRVLVGPAPFTEQEAFDHPLDVEDMDFFAVTHRSSEEREHRIIM